MRSSVALSPASPFKRDKTPTIEFVDDVRGFNRFYTRQLGLLDRGLLGSEFTLTEARVLYELAHHDDRTATQIADELAMDLGYLSRLMAKFERRRYLTRTRSPTDARQNRIQLTEKGRSVFMPLNTAAREQISRMIQPMTPEQRDELLNAMQSVQRLLEPSIASPNPQPSHAPRPDASGSDTSGPHASPHSDAPRYILRPLQIGDIGQITHRQGVLYSQEYGWDVTYEALVAEILSGFVKNFDARWENAWIAERDNAVIGSIFLVRGSEGVAKLRLLYVEPSARGLGVGKRLVEECIDDARAKGYRTMTLWTNDILVAARRIYESAGFRLVIEEPHRSFGKDLMGQTWELEL
jgi:DNA-binding MarR family transcriptional regulator/GNAT superfamily N-acetyltransferase